MTTANTNPSDDDYVPVFSVTTRRIIYIVGVICALLAGVLGVLSTDLNWPKWAIDLVILLPSLVSGTCSAFGVHYAGIGGKND